MSPRENTTSPTRTVIGMSGKRELIDWQKPSTISLMPLILAGKSLKIRMKAS
jgi:hypothetical protein